MTDSQIIGGVAILVGLVTMVFFRKFGKAGRDYMIEVYSKHDYPHWFIPPEKVTQWIYFGAGLFVTIVGILATIKYL